MRCVHPPRSIPLGGWALANSFCLNPSMCIRRYGVTRSCNRLPAGKTNEKKCRRSSQQGGSGSGGILCRRLSRWPADNQRANPEYVGWWSSFPFVGEIAPVIIHTIRFSHLSIDNLVPPPLPLHRLSDDMRYAVLDRPSPRVEMCWARGRAVRRYILASWLTAPLFSPYKVWLGSWKRAEAPSAR